MDDAGPSLKETEAAIQEALLAKQAVEQRQKHRREQIEAAEQARAALAELTAGEASDQAALESELSAAREQVEAIRVERDALMAQRMEIDRQIREADQRVKAAGQTVTGLESQLETAEKRAARTRTLQSVIAAAPEPVPQAEIDAAAKRLQDAQGRYGLAVQADNARKALEQANAVLEDATAATRRAERLRDAGRALDDVLSAMVGRVTERLRVTGGQLVVAATGEPFARLSHGQGWRIALEIAANMVGAGGIVVVPQEAWEGQDPINRAEIAAIARQVGILIVTAECGEQAAIAAEVA